MKNYIFFLLILSCHLNGTGQESTGNIKHSTPDTLNGTEQLLQPNKTKEAAANLTKKDTWHNTVYCCKALWWICQKK